MKNRSVAAAGLCAVLCGLVGWSIGAAQQGVPLQSSAQQPPMVATDRDLQLLREDLRAQKQKLIADNLPMTESAPSSCGRFITAIPRN